MGKDDYDDERSSSVILLDDANETTTTCCRRLAHLGAIFPLTTRRPGGGGRLPDHAKPILVSAWLAWSHITEEISSSSRQRRLDASAHSDAANATYNNNHVSEGATVFPLPHATRERLRNCDIQFTIEIQDSRLSNLKAAQSLSSMIGARADVNYEELAPTSLLSNATNSSIANFTTEDHAIRRPRRHPPPVALVGSLTSGVSTTLATLTGALDIPQVSATSTATHLDNKEQFPLFARTVPTNKGDATALLRYFRDIAVFHIGCLYFDESAPKAYAIDVLRFAPAFGVHVRLFPYNEETIDKAIQQLKESDRRYMVGIFAPARFGLKETLTELYNQGIVGAPGYTWIFTETSADMYAPPFALDRATESHLARAVHGSGLMMYKPRSNHVFRASMEQFYASKELRQGYIDAINEPGLGLKQSDLHGEDGPYQDMAYDAVTALAIAACECERDQFTGSELYEQLMQTKFEGVSGSVSFDPTTGTRSHDAFQYTITNARISESRSDEQIIRFDSDIAVEIGHQDGGFVKHLRPFIYSDNTTQQPPSVPPATLELNLIPTGARATGLLLCAVVVVLSCAWFGWTIANRRRGSIRASQPFFLRQLCVGTLIASLAIIPMSMQEPTSQKGLNFACMVTPWLLSAGFVCSASALLSKSWRLNKLFTRGSTFRRIRVRPQDVMLPFVVLMTCNLSLLAAWTAVAPLTWQRVAMDSFDEFERSVESYGSCASATKSSTPFVMPLIVINLLGLLLANYQAYHCRRISTAYSESKYIFIANLVLLETAVIGLPVFALVGESPTISFLVASVVITVSCLGVLLPIFVPKMMQLEEEELFCQVRQANLLDRIKCDQDDATYSRHHAGGSRRDSLRGSFLGSSMGLGASRRSIHVSGHCSIGDMSGFDNASSHHQLNPAEDSTSLFVAAEAGDKKHILGRSQIIRLTGFYLELAAIEARALVKKKDNDDAPPSSSSMGRRALFAIRRFVARLLSAGAGSADKLLALSSAAGAVNRAIAAKKISAALKSSIADGVIVFDSECSEIRFDGGRNDPLFHAAFAFEDTFPSSIAVSFATDGFDVNAVENAANRKSEVASSLVEE